MSVETAVEVLLPEVQQAIPKDGIVATIVPELYTFWRQNRPGVLTYPWMLLFINKRVLFSSATI